MFTETLIRELRHAERSLRRDPVFSVAAVLTLALGIGATTAVFSVLYGVLLSPLPFPDGDQSGAPLLHQPPAEHRPGADEPFGPVGHEDRRPFGCRGVTAVHYEGTLRTTPATPSAFRLTWSRPIS